MMLSQFTQALADAKCSVQLDASFVKGYVRVSKCHVALGDAISAQQAIEKALQIEPNNTAALQEKTSIQQLITYLGDYNQSYQAKDYRKVNNSFNDNRNTCVYICTVFLTVALTYFLKCS